VSDQFAELLLVDVQSRGDLPIESTSFERSWGTVPERAWLRTAVARSEEGPRW